MASDTEYWQCTHTRKCKWVGLFNELDNVDSKEHSDINATDQVCPKCGNREFYVLNEKEYQTLMEKK